IGADHDLAAVEWRAGIGLELLERRSAGRGDAVLQGGRRDVERRGHEAANVDLGTAAKQDAVLIDEIDPAVRAQRAEYLTRVGLEYLVERERVRAGLHEPDGRVLADVETLPVEDGVVGGLVDRQSCTDLRRRRLPGGHPGLRSAGPAAAGD